LVLTTVVFGDFDAGYFLTKRFSTSNIFYGHRKVTMQ
jgi:hypothetical protein